MRPRGRVGRAPGRYRRDAIRERWAAEPAQLGQHQTRAQTGQAGDQDDEAGHRSTRGSWGRRMIRPAHSQQATTRASPTTTMSWPHAVS